MLIKAASRYLLQIPSLMSKLLPSLLIALLLFGFPLSALRAQNAAFVNPFIGTGGHGHTFPGATVPFGMVQLSPDTRIDGSWDGCSGYHFSDSILYGFSHTHLSGTGVSDYGDVLLLPLTQFDGYASHQHSAQFSHQKETAQPGFYSVQLTSNDIHVALTATNRVGFHLYNYPKNANRLVFLDLAHRDATTEVALDFVHPKRITGMRRSKAWATDQVVYFVIDFEEPLAAFDDSEFAHHKTALLDFGPGGPLKIKVGLSFTSVDAAINNLLTEIPHWDFNAIRESAFLNWEAALSKIQVFGGSPKDRTAFYSALYHTRIHPNTASDIAGTYRGADKQTYVDALRTHYTVFSLWDTYRALHPLFTITDSALTVAFIRTLLDSYQKGGRLPVWELAANETDCMIGYHSVSVIADAYAKGIRGFDAQLALQAMMASASWNHLGLPEYQAHGHLDVEHEHESVSKTLEYAYDDWCIANFAEAIGQQAVADSFFLRAQYWKNLLDENSSFIRPRKNGGWLEPFDPREVNNHYTEANGWQYNFFVPQDIEGHIAAHGGAKDYAQQLDKMFAEPMQTTGRTQVDITGLIGQYAHGNEPSHHMAYLYNYVGQPEKTRALVQTIMNDFYSDQPDGYIGNEDAGQMSAWLALSALGFYSVTPGWPHYAIGYPLFDSAVVQLENGQTFKVVRNAVNTGNYPYRLFLRHTEIMAGATLCFDDKGAWIAGSTATDPDWRTTQSGPNITPIPLIAAENTVFTDRQKISISARAGHQIRYRMLNATDSTEWQQYKKPFFISATAQIEAEAIHDGRPSKPVQAKFFKRPNNFKISLNSTYNRQYTAGGPDGLLDGVRGDHNWRKGYWQGYQGQDFSAIVDLGKVQDIQKVAAGFLQDSRSWILMPQHVQFRFSEDGKSWTTAAVVTHAVDPKDTDVQIQDLEYLLAAPIRARFIEVTATNFGTLPTWHQGAGFEAFIFVDEIVVE